MEDYNKIIESLGVRYLKAESVDVVSAVTVENLYDTENTLILVNKGQILYGDNYEDVKDGEILFIPGGKSANLSYGDKAKAISHDNFINSKEEYLHSYPGLPNNESVNTNYSYVNFAAKIFDSVSFFTSLDIPPFKIKSARISSLVKSILEESVSQDVGNNRLVKTYTEQLVVESVRYIMSERLFVEQLATNSTYFKDPRLIDIFTYIKKSIGGDLSNKVLASVANVSEDYVGQYFKMLTGINLQDYIEYQRMEEAVNLLRTTKKSIREIGKEVGYKDTAYFCRRFKMMFGIPAGKMRRRESLMNV